MFCPIIANSSLFQKLWLMHGMTTLAQKITRGDLHHARRETANVRTNQLDQLQRHTHLE
jgi:hypothetical protein